MHQGKRSLQSALPGAPQSSEKPQTSLLISAHIVHLWANSSLAPFHHPSSYFSHAGQSHCSYITLPRLSGAPANPRTQWLCTRQSSVSQCPALLRLELQEAHIHPWAAAELMLLWDSDLHKEPCPSAPPLNTSAFLSSLHLLLPLQCCFAHSTALLGHEACQCKQIPFSPPKACRHLSSQSGIVSAKRPARNCSSGNVTPNFIAAPQCMR